MVGPVFCVANCQENRRCGGCEKAAVAHVAGVVETVRLRDLSRGCLDFKPCVVATPVRREGVR